MPFSRTADLVIVGGGISGTALLFAAARYSNIRRILLIEKYAGLAQVNSAATHNSQTLHCGDIETNYTLAKALKVKRAASLVENYTTRVAPGETLLHRYSKMVLGVGLEECARLRARFAEFGPHYPALRLFEKSEIARLEPNVVAVQGKVRPEELVACGAENEYTAANFSALAASFANHARAANKEVELLLNTRVAQVRAAGNAFEVVTDAGVIAAGSVVVSAGGHSLFLAQQMGYGQEFSCLPMAGSFYFAPPVLNGKVYTVQNDKLPFAAIHGDPDLLVPGTTRFGPTAFIVPELERYRLATVLDFLRVVRFDTALIKVLWDMFADRDVRRYIFKNMLFEIPLIRRHLFLRDARKIVPSLQARDLRFARRVGGLRPQLIDRNTRRLLMGEAKINPGNGVIFNMTPSPGATSCLDNAEQDLRSVAQHLGASFDSVRFRSELEEGKI
ncbi:MAG TPA: FAD-dependent oxidoreductase [Acidiferrobacterales bacterium]|nr:FAD-dependent oxidoreductase [Acidiferrobacterales bacterium]